MNSYIRFPFIFSVVLTHAQIAFAQLTGDDCFAFSDLAMQVASSRDSGVTQAEVTRLATCERFSEEHCEAVHSTIRFVFSQEQMGPGDISLKVLESCLAAAVESLE